MRSMYRVEDVRCENEGIVVLTKAVNPGYDILLLNVIGHFAILSGVTSYHLVISVLSLSTVRHLYLFSLSLSVSLSLHIST